MLYEPLINKLSYLYQKNFLNDKFSLSLDKKGKNVVTGGYNNIIHIIDLDQMLNTQIIIEETNENFKTKNVIRKINRKGCCFYKKDDSSIQNINFDKKILHQKFSPNENYIVLTALNCIYTFTGKLLK